MFALVVLFATGWPSGWLFSVLLGACPILLPFAKAFRLGSSKPPEAVHERRAASPWPTLLPGTPQAGGSAMMWAMESGECGPRAFYGQCDLGPALYLTEPVSLFLK